MKVTIHSKPKKKNLKESIVINYTLARSRHARTLLDVLKLAGYPFIGNVLEDSVEEIWNGRRVPRVA